MNLKLRAQLNWKMVLGGEPLIKSIAVPARPRPAAALCNVGYK